MLKKLSFLLKKEYLLLLVIILIGSFIRLEGIFTNSFAFTYDVGRDLLALWDIQYLHKFSLIGPTSGLPGVFYGPWWYLLLFPFFILFSGNPQLLTLVIALSGILTIIFAYTFGKRVGGMSLGLTFASLISVSSGLTSLSSQIWSPNIVPIFIVFVFYCLHEIYSQKYKLIYFFLLGFLLALIAESGIVFGFLFLAGIFISLFVILKRKFSIKLLTSFFLGVLVIFSPRIIFDLRHEFLMTKSFINFLTSGDSSQNYQLLETFINRVNILFNSFSSAIALDNKIIGISVLVFISIVLILSFNKASQIFKKFIKTSLIVLIVFLLGLTFFKHDIWPHYLIGLPVIYILLFSISISLLIQKTKNFVFPGVLVLILFLINLNVINLVNNFNKPLWVGDASVYRNQIEVIDYVYKEANGKDFKYVVYTPPVHDYTYRYLFKWLGSNKNYYLPSSSSHLAYFILEPDPQYPFRLTEWLKQREKDGKIVKTEKFKSGIIVETRVNQ